MRHLADVVLDGNTMYQSDPSLGERWTEDWLLKKYGEAELEALSRQAAERLAQLPEYAREAARPRIIAETFDPLVEHLLVDRGETALRPEAELPGDGWFEEYLKLTDQWTDDGAGGIIENQGRSASDNSPQKAYNHNGNSLLSLSRNYVNKSDQLFRNLSNVKPIEGFEDFGVHGVPDMSMVLYKTTNEVETMYNGTELAEIIKSDPSYKGGNVRLLSCGAGSEQSKVAQDCANALHRVVLAPTETLWVAENGRMFISNNDILAQMWYNSGSIDNGIRQTGKWKTFIPDE